MAHAHVGENLGDMMWLRVTGMPAEQVEINRLKALLCGPPVTSVVPDVFLGIGAGIGGARVLLYLCAIWATWMVDGSWTWRPRF